MLLYQQERPTKTMALQKSTSLSHPLIYDMHLRSLSSLSYVFHHHLLHFLSLLINYSYSRSPSSYFSSHWNASPLVASKTGCLVRIHAPPNNRNMWKLLRMCLHIGQKMLSPRPRTHSSLLQHDIPFSNPSCFIFGYLVLLLLFWYFVFIICVPVMCLFLLAFV